MPFCLRVATTQGRCHKSQPANRSSEPTLANESKSPAYGRICKRPPHRMDATRGCWAKARTQIARMTLTIKLDDDDDDADDVHDDDDDDDGDDDVVDEDDDDCDDEHDASRHHPSSI